MTTKIISTDSPVDVDDRRRFSAVVDHRMSPHIRTGSVRRLIAGCGGAGALSSAAVLAGRRGRSASAAACTSISSAVQAKSEDGGSVECESLSVGGVGGGGAAAGQKQHQRRLSSQSTGSETIV